MGYRLSPEAERDLEDVFLYGLERWGEERAITFLLSLYDRFLWLSNNPHIAPLRQDLEPRIYRSWVETPYVIFYRIDETQIDILAIIHGKRDIVEHFKQAR